MYRRNNFLTFFVIALCVVLSVAFVGFYIANPQNSGENKGTALIDRGKNDPPKPDDPVKDPANINDPVIDYGKDDPNVPEQPKENRVSFLAVGDNIIHGSVMEDAKLNAARLENSTQEFDFLPMYENVRDIIEEADIAFINQEAPLAGKQLGYTGYPNFNSPEQVVYDLIDLGFDVFNMANNHMLDKKTAGYKATVDFYASFPNITQIGGYATKEDYEKIRIIEKNGISIAFLSYTYGTNGMTLDETSGMVVPLADDAEINRQTKLARELADFVIVSMHWGTESSFNLNDAQKRQTEIMVNNGVDVIIGTHPHVLQPAKWQARPDGGRTLVMYSIGNFLSGMEKMYYHVGLMAGFDLVKDENGTRVENVSMIPTLCHFDYNIRSYKIYKLSEYTSELLSTHGRQQPGGTDTTRDMNYLYDIVRSNIPNDFLTEDFYRSY